MIRNFTLLELRSDEVHRMKELLGKVKGVLVPRIEERESLVKKRTGKRGSARLVSYFADLGHRD
jgi:hypothetical protein